jgi:hypothetical protein
VQSAPVQHPFMLELENLFNNKTMDCGTRFDGKTISPMFQFANVVNDKPINDKHGHGMVKRMLDNPIHKFALDKYGIHEIRTQRGAIVPAMTFLGMKEFLSKLKCDFADRFRAYEHYLTTLVEASDPLINRLMEANAASSSVYLAQARNSVAQEAASAGPSIAPPPEQVLAEGTCCLQINGMWFKTEELAKLYLETEKIKVEKMENLENTAQREHENLENKAQREHEIARMEKEWELKHRDPTTALKINPKEAPAPSTATMSPPSSTEKVKATEWGFLMHNKGTSGIRKSTSCHPKKGVRGEKVVLTKQTITSHFSRK